MRLLTWIAALPLIAVLIGIAKLAQYSVVKALSGRLGFDLASLLGVLPVIVFYYWLVVSLPSFNPREVKRG